MKNYIVVTGGAGFVGSNLIDLLLSKTKFNIISLDNYSTGSKKNHVKNREQLQNYRKNHAKSSGGTTPKSSGGNHAKISIKTAGGPLQETGTHSKNDHSKLISRRNVNQHTKTILRSKTIKLIDPGVFSTMTKFD